MGAGTMELDELNINRIIL